MLELSTFFPHPAYALLRYGGLRENVKSHLHAYNCNYMNMLLAVVNFTVFYDAKLK